MGAIVPCNSNHPALISDFDALLPNEMVFAIFHKLPFQDWNSVAKVCKRWYQITQIEQCWDWKWVCENRFSRFLQIRQVAFNSISIKPSNPLTSYFRHLHFRDNTIVSNLNARFLFECNVPTLPLGQTETLKPSVSEIPFKQYPSPSPNNTYIQAMTRLNEKYLLIGTNQNILLAIDEIDGDLYLEKDLYIDIRHVIYDVKSCGQINEQRIVLRQADTITGMVCNHFYIWNDFIHYPNDCTTVFIHLSITFFEVNAQYLVYGNMGFNNNEGYLLFGDLDHMTDPNDQEVARKFSDDMKGYKYTSALLKDNNLLFLVRSEEETLDQSIVVCKLPDSTIIKKFDLEREEIVTHLNCFRDDFLLFLRIQRPNSSDEGTEHPKDIKDIMHSGSIAILDRDFKEITPLHEFEFSLRHPIQMMVVSPSCERIAYIQNRAMAPTKIPSSFRNIPSQIKVMEIIPGAFKTF